MSEEQKEHAEVVSLETGKLDTVDPFDPEALAVPAGHELTPSARIMLDCHVGNPPRDQFVRSHPDPEMSHVMYIMKLESQRNATFILSPEVASAYEDECRQAILTVAIDRSGEPFLWVTYPKKPHEHEQNAWHRSAMLAREEAVSTWLRMKSGTRNYITEIAQVTIPEPEWPDYSFRDYLRAGFGEDRIITDPDHPVLMRLTGRQ